MGKPLASFGTDQHHAICVCGAGGLVLGEYQHSTLDRLVAVHRRDIRDACLAVCDAHDFAGAQEAKVVDGKVRLEGLVFPAEAEDAAFHHLEREILGARARYARWLDGVEHQGRTEAVGIAPAPEGFHGVEIVANGARLQDLEMNQIAFEGIDRLHVDGIDGELSKDGCEAAQVVPKVRFCVYTPLHEVAGEKLFHQFCHAEGAGAGNHLGMLCLAPAQPVDQSAGVCSCGIEKSPMAGTFAACEVVITPAPADKIDAAGVEPEGGLLAGHAPEAYPTGVLGRMSGVQRGGGAVSENEKRPANTGLFSTPRPGLEPGTYRLTAGGDYPQSHER